MFSYKHKQFSNPKLLKYIKEQNDKWLSKYSNNSVYPGLGLNVKVSDLVKEKNKKPNFPGPFFIFLGLISFIAGYNFRCLIKQV
jgi:hypothetical protein